VAVHLQPLGSPVCAVWSVSLLASAMSEADTSQANPGEMGKDVAGRPRAAASEQNASRVFDSLLQTGCRALNLPMFAFLMCVLPATSPHTAEPFGGLRSHKTPGQSGEEAAVSAGTSETPRKRQRGLSGELQHGVCC